MESTLNMTHMMWALGLGAISAISLPLGSWLGLVWKPKDSITGALAAFGAGALIAAMALELVAPTIMKLGGEDTHAITEFWHLMIGMFVGGLLFIILDQLVNAKGGFLRNSAYTLRYYSARKKSLQMEIIKDLSCVAILNEVPPAATQELVRMVRPVHFNPDEIIFNQNEMGDELYIIRNGHVEVIQDGQTVAEISEGGMFGEIALLTESPRTATLQCKSEVQALILSKKDFDTLRRNYPQLDSSIREMASKRMDELKSLRESERKADLNWTDNAIEALQTGATPPTPREMKEMHAHHEGAPLAIWLGIMLDGIPESFVIGTGLLAILSHQASMGIDPSFASVVPYTLIAGLFLSNFPEALSSSVGMEEQGLSRKKILGLWTSLLVLTSLGAGFGYYLGEAMNHTTLVGIEGMAAGAMLTMIAAAMLPEAAHKGGGNTSGLFTLLGFIAALSFKLLE